MNGFPYTEIEHLITVGFGRQTLLNAADTVIDLVSQKKTAPRLLVGGCDGSRDERSYFTDFARSVPQDCLIMTLACGKRRFNKLDFGTGRVAAPGRRPVQRRLLRHHAGGQAGGHARLQRQRAAAQLVLSGLNRRRSSFC